MSDFWHKISIWVEVGIIIFTLFLIAVDGFSIKYIVILVGDTVSLLFDLLERKSRNP